MQYIELHSLNYEKQKFMERTMKKMIYMLLILLAVSTGIFAQVNGELTQMDNKWILQTWGTHQERGFAQGYLLSQQILQIYQNYIYDILAMGSPVVYNTIVSFYLDNFVVEAKYELEAQGIIEGMAASGANIYFADLGRNLNKDDILTFNCIVDIFPYFSTRNAIGGSAPGCASLSSWGVSTQADSLLNGSVVISRLLDWDTNPALIANPLLVVSHPSEPDEQKMISFTYPGMIGTLSAISVSGKAAFLNMGNVHSYSSLTELNPVLFSIRNGLEMIDFNQDELDNNTDVFDAVDFDLALSGTIIHTVSENPDVMAGVIENNNASGAVLRTMAENGSIPGNHLIATNHFRLLNPPVCCTRYANIADSLINNSEVTAKRQLNIIKGAAGMDNNMMAMQYTPASGTILWSTATLNQPAFENQMITLDANYLFGYSTALEDETQTPIASLLRAYPNPVRINTIVTIENKTKSTQPLEVFNLKGQKIKSIESTGNFYKWDGKNEQGRVSGAGIYLLKIKDTPQAKKGIKLVLLP